jgi:hypothetical protein
MSLCPLTNGYNIPCRQISGVKTVYLAGEDNNFSISLTLSIDNFNVIYEDNQTNNGDVYTPGTYTLDLQYMSNNSDLYTNDIFDAFYYLPGWVNGTITVIIGDVPVNPNDYQSVSITINTINNNFGLSYFVIPLSSVIIPSIDNNDSVILGVVLTQGPTYGITNFSRNFYHFNQRLEQASFLESGIYGENGTLAYNQKLEITLEGYDQNTKNIISLLNKSRLRGIIVDQNGDYYLIGYQNYLTSTTTEGGLGKTLVDGVKTTLTFEGKELGLAYSLDNTVILNGILIG